MYLPVTQLDVFSYFAAAKPLYLECDASSKLKYFFLWFKISDFKDLFGSEKLGYFEYAKETTVSADGDCCHDDHSGVSF